MGINGSIFSRQPRPQVMDSKSSLRKPLVISEKLLMGPGPSNLHPRAISAMAQPILGHFHIRTFEIMDEVKEGIRYIFDTTNELTLALSTSGHGGMEAALSNLVEQEDTVLILVNGIWGHRAADMAARYGGTVEIEEVPAGQNFTLSQIREAIKKYNPDVLFVTQGESSTGVCQPIAGIGPICRKFNCLLVVDTVASLGAVKFRADAWEVDCAYTGSQKTLGAPPGITPITFSDRAMEKIQHRHSKPPVFYWDMELIGQYWGCYPGKPRIYHHTISTPLLFALREALAAVMEEGIENCISRHTRATAHLHEGLRKLSLNFFVEDSEARLPTVTTVHVPTTCSWEKLVRIMLNEYDVEISGGLGPTANKVLRIGVMGVNANSAKVSRCLDALRRGLTKSSL